MPTKAQKCLGNGRIHGRDEEAAIEDGIQPTCISAIQAAYDIRINDGEDVFASELQCEPIRIDTFTGETNKATRADLKSSVVTIPRGVIPVDLNRLVIYADIHKNLFYWVGVAKNIETNTRHVFDYNTWPEQSARRFTLENAKRTIPQLYPGLGLKALAEKAVGEFLTYICAKTLEISEWPFHLCR